MRVIELRGPADVQFVRVVRTAVLSVASQAGLPIDPADEMRMAVDEACNVLIAAHAPALVVSFVEDDNLTVTVRSTRPVDVHIDATTELILKTMSDNVSIHADGTISLAKNLG